MNKSLLLIFLAAVLLFWNSHPVLAQTLQYDLNFSTYLGGSDFEHARDVVVDNQGDIIVVGGANSPNFPITLGSPINTSGTDTASCGQMDAFICKFTPTGQRIWCRLLGGPNYDRAYGVRVDSNGYIYISGRAGRGFPTTTGVFQPTFHGSDKSQSTCYGGQNAFVAKLDPNGNVIWASYAGSAGLSRSITVASNGDIYAPIGTEGLSLTPEPDPSYYTGYQKTRKGGQDCGILRIKNDGTQVLNGTWVSGTGYDGEASSIVVDDNYVYIYVYTDSTDIPTPNGYDQSINGGYDSYVAKFSRDLNTLYWGTYIGGSGTELTSTHNIAVDNSGNVYISIWTSSTNFPNTTSAYDSSYNGGNSDWAVVKFSPTGALLASTYIGGDGIENTDGIWIDSNQNVYLTGDTQSTNFPVTPNAYQNTSGGGRDASLVVLSADFSHLLYSTYMGCTDTGNAASNVNSGDQFRSSYLDAAGNIYAVGSTDSLCWPIKNEFQSNFGGGVNDVVVAKFTLSGNPQNCSQLFGSCCSTGQVCSSGPFTPSTDCSYCCVGGTCRTPLCPDSFCDPGETCPADNCCAGFTYNPSTQVCCSGSLYTGNCCSDSDCTPQLCTNHVCSAPIPICTGLVLLHHYDNNPNFGESSTYAYDFSGNGNNGTTQYNAFINTTAGKFSGAAQFDGDGDMVLVTNKPSLNFGSNVQFAVSMWVKINNSDNMQSVIYKRSNAGYMIRLLGLPTIFRIDEGANNMDTSFTYPFDNQWHHIVAMRNATHHSVWVDGIIKGYTVDNTLADLTDTSDLAIGNEIGYAPSAITGSIDELAIWNRSLSSQEIQSLYSSGSPITCGNCIHKSDNNPCDGCVDMTELLAFINRWHINNLDVTMKELMEAIGLWNKGCSG